jgi:hypothetical protein
MFVPGLESIHLSLSAGVRVGVVLGQVPSPSTPNTSEFLIDWWLLEKSQASLDEFTHISDAMEASQ